MLPNDLPQPELELLTQSLLSALAKGAGNHERAVFHLDLEGTRDQIQITAVRGGELKSAEPNAHEKSAFVGLNHSKAHMTLLTAAVAARTPLYMLHYDFTREAGSWRYRLLVQSLEEYQQMLKERRALDDAIEVEMVEAAGEGWARLALARQDVGAVQPLTLLGFYAKSERKSLMISPPLAASVDAFWEFHRERGFKLDLMRFGLAGGLRGRERDFVVRYGSLSETAG